MNTTVSYCAGIWVLIRKDEVHTNLIQQIDSIINDLVLMNTRCWWIDDVDNFIGRHG